MTTLNRKLLRELRSSRGLLFTVMSIISLGVMCFVYIRSSYNNLRWAQASYYARCRLADFWIDLKKAPISAIEQLGSLPGVTHVESRIGFHATVDIPGVLEPLNGLVLSLPDRRSSSINDILVRRGSYFTQDSRAEVIVNERFAAEHSLNPGDRIHLLLNNRRQELLVVGTAISAEFVYLVAPGTITPDPRHFGVFYVKRTYAEEVFDFEGAANQAVGLLSPQVRERPGRLLRQAETLLEPYGVFGTVARADQISNRFLSDEIRGLGVFSTILPTIFLSVAALVLNVLMMRLIDQQRTVIGTLKALGYGNLAVFWHYQKFGAIVGVVGAMLGVLLGYAMAGWLTSIYRHFYQFPRLENHLQPPIYLFAILLGVFCASVGCFIGSRRALRLQPAQAMRPAPPKAGGRIWLERMGWFWRSLSFAWRMALRSLMRSRIRTAVGVFAAAVGAAILLSGFMMSHGVMHLVRFQFEKIVFSDMDLRFEKEQGWEAFLEARGLPGVDYAEPVLEVGCDFLHGPYRKKGAVTGLLPNAQLTRPRDIHGNLVPVPEVGLVMSRKLASLLGLKVGQRVTVVPIKGLKRPVEAPVAKITDSYLGMSVYADFRYLNHLVQEQSALTGVQLLLNPSPHAARDFFAAVKQIPAIQSTYARRNAIDNLLDTVVKVQSIFIHLLTAFAGVIYFGSVLNASLVSLAERQREVATLHVLGYSPLQIGLLFLRENLLVTMCGTCLGLPLGYLLTWYVTWVYDTEMFRFPLVAPLSAWIRTIITGLVFALVAHAWVQRKIFGLHWLEALKVSE